MPKITFYPITDLISVFEGQVALIKIKLYLGSWLRTY